MQKIANEIHEATSALTINRSPPDKNHASHPPAILDLCMAPGGFAQVALTLNPTASLRGVTLPESSSRHKILVPNWEKDPRIQMLHCDITMLAAEMGVDLVDIPTNHPDASGFLSSRPFHNQEFDLVFCDGVVLRTQDRHEYRDKQFEVPRLTTSQLVLALQRIRDGGTLIMLMHRANSWQTVSILHALNSFASIRLFKPTLGHKTRSSFYLVAQNVRPRSAAAVKAVQKWKKQWKAATFRDGPGESKDGEALGDASKEEVVAALDEFGPKLINLAEPVFKLHVEGLSHASFMHANSNKSKFMTNWRGREAGSDVGLGPKQEPKLERDLNLERGPKPMQETKWSRVSKPERESKSEREPKPEQETKWDRGSKFDSNWRVRKI
ncbi:hypothetical protein B0T17DRAFT_517872 [Bombardia bombarda]|uniref:Ribosomal RNA methyltransferase FtsJ domain-containing protein n=1 Tax=Bombardia bombarda TaxID=252184 RepID=A0AA39XL35_9PEZI|nr:hypothetical protein B0T17DRAFT_517872 [Bombardia bombarda]